MSSCPESPGAALVEGTRISSAPSCAASHGRTGCQASLQISTAVRPWRVSNARSDWPGLEQVFCSERQRVDLKTGAREHETVYGLTSLSPAEACAERLLGLVRAYWGIENGLHQRRDVTFREDRTRLTHGSAGWVVASLNNLVIGLLRQAGATNLAAARRQLDARLTLSLAQTFARSLT